MLRSIMAMLAATIIGLTTAKFVEGAGAALFSIELGAVGADDALSYSGVLIAAWSLGAFVAATCALLIGQRWAPLGVLAAATMFLSAVIALLASPASLFVWALTAAGVAGSGWIAIKILGASFVSPTTKQKMDLFDD